MQCFEQLFSPKEGQGNFNVLYKNILISDSGIVSYSEGNTPVTLFIQNITLYIVGNGTQRNRELSTIVLLNANQTWLTGISYCIIM